MLADRLGRCFTGNGDKPCTLQVPRLSLQIFSCKVIMVDSLLSAGRRAAARGRSGASGCRPQSPLTAGRSQRPRAQCAARYSDALPRRLTEMGALAVVRHDFCQNPKEPWSTFRFLTRRGVQVIRKDQRVSFRAGTAARAIKNAKNESGYARASAPRKRNSAGHARGRPSPPPSPNSSGEPLLVLAGGCRLDQV
jgi:hypothetical protein